MEKIINYIVGIIVLTNLYYFNNIIGIPRDVLIILNILISLFYFIRNWSNKIRSLLGMKFSLSLSLLSLILFSLNSLFFEYEFYPNDILRVLLYTFYFGWTFSLYKNNKEDFQKYLITLLELIIIIIIIMTYFEYFFTIFFKQIIYGNLDNFTYNDRICLTFMDANSCAAAISVFLFIYINLKGTGIKSLIFFVFSILIIFLTASRMGFILAILILLIKIDKFFNISGLSLKIIFYSVFFLLLGALGFLNSEQLMIKDSNDSSIINRLNTSNDESSRSNEGRIISIKSGFKASDFSNLILPPGNFLFRSKWEKNVREKLYPHSTIVYMLVEYGIFIFWPLLIIKSVFKKAKLLNLQFLFLLLIIILLFLPNSIYYSTFFLILFYIEIHYEYCSNTSILTK